MACAFSREFRRKIIKSRILRNGSVAVGGSICCKVLWRLWIGRGQWIDCAGAIAHLDARYFAALKG